MDEAVFVVFLFTGFCVPSAPFPKVYYFIRETMTWNEAQAYCISEHSAMAQMHNMEDVTMVLNTPTGGSMDTDKAWIGLYENVSEWTWVDGEPATYFNWSAGQPDNADTHEFCVTMAEGGYWHDVSCSVKRSHVCHAGGSYSFDVLVLEDISEGTVF